MLKTDLDLYYHTGDYFQDEDKHPVIQGKTFTKDDTFYIVFSASHGFWDYLINFMFPKYPVEYNSRCTAHIGYVYRYNDLHERLLTRYIMSQCSKLHIVGYSMGASVALLCAYHFSKITYPTVTCFEPLAICNRKLKNYLEENAHIEYTRYGNDAVVKLLFWNKHVGTEHHFGPPTKWWKFSAKDHPLENIRTALQTL